MNHAQRASNGGYMHYNGGGGQSQSMYMYHNNNNTNNRARAAPQRPPQGINYVQSHPPRAPSYPPSQQSLHHLMSTSVEHQKCVQFLRSRNFLSSTPLGQRQMILQKIRNALTQKYQHQELHRRTQILKQCATYVLQQTQTQSNSTTNSNSNSNSAHHTTNDRNNNNNNNTHNNVMFDDLLSAPITHTNTNTNSTHTATHEDDFSDFASAPPTTNSTTNSFNAFEPHTSSPNDTTFEEFSAGPPPVAPTDSFDAFDDAPPPPLNGDTFDLLGGLNNNGETTAIHNAEPAAEEEDNFMDFIKTIKPKPTIDEYMKAAFDDKLHSINQRGQEKLSAMSISSPKSTTAPIGIGSGIGSSTVMSFPTKRHVPSKAIPDILNKLIVDKLNEDDFGEGFDDFQEAEEIANSNNEDNGATVEQSGGLVQAESNIMDDANVAAVVEEAHTHTEEAPETEEANDDENAFDIPMDEFLNAAHDASAEYEDKMKIREEELNKKKENHLLSALDDENTFNPFVEDTQPPQEMEFNHITHTADANMPHDDPFLALFGAPPPPVQAISTNANNDNDNENAIAIDDDDWGNFDAAAADDDETVKNGEAFEVNDTAEDIQMDQFFEAQFESEPKEKEKEKKLSKKEKKKRRKEKRKREKEKQKQMEREKEIETEKEKQRQKEKEKEMEKEKEKEIERQKEKEKEKKKEAERQKQKEIETEKEKERVKQMEKEKRRKERKRKKKEKQKQKQREKEEEIEREKEKKKHKIKEKETTTSDTVRDNEEILQLPMPDEDGWGGFDVESPKKEESARDDFFESQFQSQITPKDNTQSQSPTQNEGESVEDDEEDWGGFDAPAEAPSTSQLHIETALEPPPTNEAEAEAEDDWGDFGEMEDANNDNNNNVAETEEITDDKMDKILSEEPSVSIIGGDLDDLREPSSLQRAMSMSQREREDDREMSLSGLNHINFISDHNHHNLDLDDDAFAAHKTEELSVSRSITQHEENEEEEAEEAEEEQELEVVQPYQNPFAALIDGEDAMSDADGDADADAMSDADGDAMDHNPFEIDDDDDMDRDEEEHETKEAKEKEANSKKEKGEKRKDYSAEIAEAIENEQYEKALLLYKLEEKDSELRVNKSETQRLEREMREKHTQSNDEDEASIAAKQERLKALIEFEENKIRLKREMKEIESDIRTQKLNSMDIHCYAELCAMSRRYDKWTQFQELFSIEFAQYLSSPHVVKTEELEQVILEQKRAHFFIFYVSSSEKTATIDFKLYKQLLQLAHNEFEDINSKLRQLTDHLLTLQNKKFFAQSNNERFADVFVLRLDYFLILYKICKTIGNGLDLIKNAFETHEIVQQCLALWRTINEIFNEAILKTRNEILNEFIINNDSYRHRHSTDQRDKLIWNLTEYNENNDILPNKEQISQILMHMNQI